MPFYCYLAPTRPPPNFKVISRTSHDFISLEWNYLSLEYVHGDLKGYKVIYRALVIDSQNVLSPKYDFVVVHPFKRKLTIGGLHSNSKYSFQLLAMNEHGDGVASHEIQGGMI